MTKPLNREADTDLLKASQGYEYKITLPPGMGAPLYSRSLHAAVAMVRYYGKGTTAKPLTPITLEERYALISDRHHMD